MGELISPNMSFLHTETPEIPTEEKLKSSFGLTDRFIFKRSLVWLAVSCSLCKCSTAVTSEEMHQMNVFYGHHAEPFRHNPLLGSRL